MRTPRDHKARRVLAVAFCWWELVVAVTGLVVGAVMLPTAIMEDDRVSAWLAAIAFAMFSVVAAACFWKLWSY